MRNLLGFLLLVGGCCGSQCLADTGLYSFEQECATVNCLTNAGPASCVCVGVTAAGDACVLTAAHCVEERGNVFYAVGSDGTRHRCWVVYVDTDADIAAMVCQHNLMACDGISIEAPRVRSRVKLKCVLTRRYLDSDGEITRVTKTRMYARNLWSHPGASGGAWFDEHDRLIGIHSGIVVDSKEGISANGEAMSVAIAAFQKRYGKFRRQVQTQQSRYPSQCGPIGCPIQVRPYVQQPVLGIGIPVGPPRVIGVAEPAPQRYVPMPSQPVPDPISVTGPRGEPGRDGKDGKSVTQEQVQIAVDTYLESNIDRLKAPPITQDQIDLSVRKHFEANPVTVTAPSPAEPVDDRRLLYFTSTEGCANCRETDATVARLKASGYPITVIDLEPTETQVRGVPRLHILKETRDISGASNVSTYLGLLVR